MDPFLSRMKTRTRVTHPPVVTLPPDNDALVAPVYQSVKFALPALVEMEKVVNHEREGFVYSRVANPTVRQLEKLVAELQEREDAVALGSGMAAVTVALFALTRQGDHVVCFVESYKPSRYVIRQQLGRFGVRNTLLSIDDLDGLESVLDANDTRLVFFESPTNPMNKIADIERICRVAREHGALTLMDNTVAGLHNHAAFDVDYYIHSLTKYASGHGDVMGGAVIGNSKDLQTVRFEASQLGAVLDPHAAFLIVRGLKTYVVRYRQQVENADEVARYLSGRDEVHHVYYPGLPGDRDHALAKRQMDDFGTIVSVDLAGDVGNMRRFLDALELFHISFSLGSTESLVMPPGLFAASDLNAEEASSARISPTSVRLRSVSRTPAISSRISSGDSEQPFETCRA